MKARLKLRGFDLNTVIEGTSLPILTGDIEIDANKYSIVTNSNIMVYDRDYGKLGGRFKTDIVLDLSNKHSLINLRTYNARYNYEPFTLDLLVEGSLDSLQIKHFQINKMIEIDGWIKRLPKFKYGLLIHAKDLKVAELSRYFVDYYISQQLQGNLSINANVDNLGEGHISGLVNINDFKIGEMNELDGRLNLSGNSSMISIQDGSIKINENKIINLNGALIIKPEIIITANGMIDSLQLTDILPKGNLSGVVKGGIEFSRSLNKNELQLDLEVTDLKMNRFKADLLKFDILQKDCLL